MNFYDDEDWDIELLDDLVRKEEEAIAAKRASQQQQQAAPFLAPPGPSILSFAGPSAGSNATGSALSLPPPPRKPPPPPPPPFRQKASSSAADYYHFVSTWKDDGNISKCKGQGEEEASVISLPYLPQDLTSAVTPEMMPITQTLANDKAISQCLPRHSGSSYAGQPPEASRHLAKDHSPLSRPLEEGLGLENYGKCERPSPAVQFEANHCIGRLMTSDHMDTAKQRGLGAPEQWGYSVQARACQADLELGELPRKAIHLSEVSNLQKEIERLQSQIMFKDQEIHEARRSYAVVSEQLKRVSEQVDFLQKEVEQKRTRSSEGSTDVNQREDNKELHLPRTLSASRLDAAGNQGAQNQDLWHVPWAPERVSKTGLPKMKIPSTPGAQHPQNEVVEADGKLAAELKVRTLDNGCTSSSQNESMNFQPPQEAALMDSIRPLSGTKKKLYSAVLGDGNEGPSWKKNSGDQQKLLKIWNSGNTRKDCTRLLLKLFTRSQEDIHVLLSVGIEGGDCGRKPDKDLCFGQAEETEPGSLGTRGLHSVLGKMANGLASTWTFFITVLEMCKLESIQVVESALRVLHCVLIHDEYCQRQVFGRSVFQLPKKAEFNKPESLAQFSQNVQRSVIGTDFGSFQDDLGSSVQVLKPCVSSSRIYFKIGSIDILPLKQSDTNVLGSEHAKAKESLCASSIEGKQDTFFAALFTNFLSMALKGISQCIKIEALSILNFLVNSSEPIAEREHFGSILLDGSIASLLKRTTNVDVRLQAVRFVHAVLHCPTVLERFCLPETLEERSERSLQTDNHLAEREDSKPGTWGTIEILDGLVSCLFYSLGSFQEYTLRRNALRLLTFIATSGHRGAAILLAFKSNSCKGDYEKEVKAEGMKGQKPVPAFAGTLPVHLVAMLDQELNLEEEEDFSSRLTEGEERECLICESFTLLCRLASHPVVSTATLAALTVDKVTAMLSACVSSRLMRRGLLFETLKIEDKCTVSPADMIELARGLRRRILSSKVYQ